MREELDPLDLAVANARRHCGLKALFTACPSAFFLPDAVPSDSASQGEAGKRLAGVKLRLVVVDDPAIANAVRGLRDEWNAQTGSEVEVIEITEKRISQTPTTSCRLRDAVICPEYLLGIQAEAKRLAPVPQSIARDPQGPWSQTFELLRNQEAVWGNEVYGVPLGSPVFCCYYRADLLEKLHRKPPQTWKEYEDLARLAREERSKVRDDRAVGPRLGGARAPGAGRGLCQGARQLYDAV